MSWVPIDASNAQTHSKAAALPDLLHAINANMVSKELELQTQYDVLYKKACANADSSIHHAQEEASKQVATMQKEADEMFLSYQRDIEAQRGSHAELARSHAELSSSLAASMAEVDGLKFAYNLVIDSYGTHLRDELRSKQDEITHLTGDLAREREEHNRAVGLLTSQQALRDKLRSKQGEITHLTGDLARERDEHKRAIGLLTSQQALRDELRSKQDEITHLTGEIAREGKEYNHTLGLLTSQLEDSKRSYTNVVRERLKARSS
jgi:hypothetical protein